MEQTIKMEVKIEKTEPRDENDPTPLRETIEESPPRACAFEPATSVSKCGWDSDLEEIELPATPGSSLQALQPKDEFKVVAILDEMLNETAMPNVGVPPPPPPPPTHPLDTSSYPPPPALNPALDGLPSAYTARENLDDMDLCSLGDNNNSDAELMAEKMEILRKLAMMNGSNKEGSGEQKEKKKKSKKRKRSHRSTKEEEEEAESRKQPRTSTSPDESQREANRSQGPHWPGRRIKPEKPDLDYVSVRTEEMRLRVVKASNLFESQTPKLVPKTENLSIKDKRQLGVARAQLALQLFEKNANKEDERDALMVDTMCKLPVHDSFRNQNCFENPSPLCNNRNVAYEFNTAPGTRIDLAKWGLEVLPEPIRVLCRILGIDIHRLKELRRTATPSQRILKLKQERMEQGVGSEDADADKATLYKNAATQADIKTSTHEIGIQARMEAPPKGSTFWQKPTFSATELTQQQSNVMYALQELTKAIPNAALAETLYRRLGPALAIARQSK
ncbi:hypothetical protein KR032_006001 [Drosophila birchii]|nr:hypothetical protein KR032_006001 [Drosophila birchii]